jgi:hypothetical protein
VLVSNNVYGMGDIAGLGRRSRMDRGTLGVFGSTLGVFGITVAAPSRRPDCWVGPTRAG